MNSGAKKGKTCLKIRRCTKQHIGGLKSSHIRPFQFQEGIDELLGHTLKL